MTPSMYELADEIKTSDGGTTESISIYELFGQKPPAVQSGTFAEPAGPPANPQPMPRAPEPAPSFGIMADGTRIDLNTPAPQPAGPPAPTESEQIFQEYRDGLVQSTDLIKNSHQYLDAYFANPNTDLKDPILNSTERQRFERLRESDATMQQHVLSAYQSGLSQSSPRRFNELVKTAANTRREMMDYLADRADQGRGYAEQNAARLESHLNDWLAQLQQVQTDAVKLGGGYIAEAEGELVGKLAEKFQNSMEAARSASQDDPVDRAKKLSDAIVAANTYATALRTRVLTTRLEKNEPGLETPETQQQRYETSFEDAKHESPAVIFADNFAKRWGKVLQPFRLWGSEFLGLPTSPYENNYSPQAKARKQAQYAANPGAVVIGHQAGSFLAPENLLLLAGAGMAGQALTPAAGAAQTVGQGIVSRGIQGAAFNVGTALNEGAAAGEMPGGEELAKSAAAGFIAPQITHGLNSIAGKFPGAATVLDQMGPESRFGLRLFGGALTNGTAMVATEYGLAQATGKEYSSDDAVRDFTTGAVMHFVMSGPGEVRRLAAETEALIPLQKYRTTREQGQTGAVKINSTAWPEYFNKEYAKAKTQEQQRETVQRLAKEMLDARAKVASQQVHDAERETWEQFKYRNYETVGEDGKAADYAAAGESTSPPPPPPPQTPPAGGKAPPPRSAKTEAPPDIVDETGRARSQKDVWRDYQSWAEKAPDEELARIRDWLKDKKTASVKGKAVARAVVEDEINRRASRNNAAAATEQGETDVASNESKASPTGPEVSEEVGASAKTPASAEPPVSRAAPASAETLTNQAPVTPEAKFSPEAKNAAQAESPRNPAQTGDMAGGDNVTPAREMVEQRVPGVVAKEGASPGDQSRDVGAVKEPWEMTREAFENLSAARQKQSASHDIRTSGDTAYAAQEHRVAVEAALGYGKKVPPEVLADYPDLVKPGASSASESGAGDALNAQGGDKPAVPATPSPETGRTGSPEQPREPWQMTRKESEKAIGTHSKIVADAIAAGKPVPPEVAREALSSAAVGDVNRVGKAMGLPPRGKKVAIAAIVDKLTQAPESASPASPEPVEEIAKPVEAVVKNIDADAKQGGHDESISESEKEGTNVEANPKSTRRDEGEEGEPVEPPKPQPRRDELGRPVETFNPKFQEGRYGGPVVSWESEPITYSDLTIKGDKKAQHFDPSKEKDAKQIVAAYQEDAGPEYKSHYSIESEKAIEAAYRTLLKPIETPSKLMFSDDQTGKMTTDTQLYALPGKENAVLGIAAKMARQLSRSGPKPSPYEPKMATPKTSPAKELPAPAKDDNGILAALDPGSRYNIDGVKLDKKGTVAVATDGHMLFQFTRNKGSFGKDGVYNLGKGGELTRKDKDSQSFVPYADVIPVEARGNGPAQAEVSSTDMESFYRRVVAAVAASKNEDKSAVLLAVNKDGTLGFAFGNKGAYGEINIKPGAEKVMALDAEKLKALVDFHLKTTTDEGGKYRYPPTLKFNWTTPNKPISIRSTGLNGSALSILMPINSDTSIKEIQNKMRETPLSAAQEKVRGAEERLAQWGGSSPASKKRLPDSEAASFSREPAPPFFLKSEQVINQKMSGNMLPVQVRAMLINAGVKPDEMKWIGIDDFLKDHKGPVSKQELLDFIRANDLKIEEVTKGNPNDQRSTQLRAIAEDYENKAIQEIISQTGKSEIEAQSSMEAFLDGDVELESFPEPLRRHLRRARTAIDDYERAANISSRGMGEPKFGQYQLPGGENYRELLLTMPEKPSPDKGPKGWGDTHGGTYDPVNFRSSHWDEPNVLAHVRYNDRTGPNGEKLLHVEEIQSDWHQKGREEGYRLPSQETEAMDSEYRRLIHKNSEAIDAGKAPDPQDVSRAKELEAELIKADNSKIPNAPFKKTWHEMALRRVLRMAAERGYDGITWTTGDQQNERYDLSKQVDYINYKKNADGTFDIKAGKADSHGHPAGGTQTVTKDNISEEELAGVVGAELAQKMINGEGKDWAGSSSPVKVFTGLDLKVGGSGMKGFYDKIIPDYLNKYGKRWNAKVGGTQIGETPVPIVPGRPDLNNANKDGPRVPVNVHYFPITDSMRESVLMEGQPLFSRGDIDAMKLAQLVKTAKSLGLPVTTRADMVKSILAKGASDAGQSGLTEPGTVAGPDAGSRVGGDDRAGPSGAEIAEADAILRSAVGDARAAESPEELTAQEAARVIVPGTVLRYFKGGNDISAGVHPLHPLIMYIKEGLSAALAQAKRFHEHVHQLDFIKDPLYQRMKDVLENPRAAVRSFIVTPVGRFYADQGPIRQVGEVIAYAIEAYERGIDVRWLNEAEHTKLKALWQEMKGRGATGIPSEPAPQGQEGTAVARGEVPDYTDASDSVPLVRVYRIQPAGKDLGKHRSTTSNENLDTGVHVFGGLEQLRSGQRGAMPGYGSKTPEIVIIETSPKNIRDNGDYEGYTLHKNQGRIVERIPFKSMKEIMDWARGDYYALSREMDPQVSAKLDDEIESLLDPMQLHAGFPTPSLDEVKELLFTIPGAFNFAVGEISRGLNKNMTGKSIIRMANVTESKTGLLVGKISNDVARAYKNLSHADKTWLQRHDQFGFANFQKMQEDSTVDEMKAAGVSGRLRPHNTALKEFSAVYGKGMSLTADVAERLKYPRTDGQPFQRSLYDRFLRMFNSDATESMHRQHGPLFDAIQKAFIRFNPGISPAKIKDVMEALSDPDPIKHNGALDRLREIPNVPAYVEVNRKWVPIIELDPISATLGAVEAMSRRLMFYQQFGGDHDVAKLRMRFTRNGGDPNQFDKVIKVLNRRPFGRLDLDPRSIGVRLAKAGDQAMSQLMLSLSAAPNLFQPVMMVRRTGLKNLLLAYADAVGDRRSTLAQSYALGTMMPDLMNWTVREGQAIEDITRIGRGFASRFFLHHWVNKLNNMVASMAFKRLANYWEHQGFTDADVPTAEFLRLNQKQIEQLKQGKMTLLTRAMIVQNGVKRTQYNTEDPHHKSELQNIPLLNGLAKFNSYFIGMGKENWSLVQETASAVKSGNKKAMQRIGWMLFASLVSAVGVGFATLMVKRGVRGQQLIREDEDWKSLLLKSLQEVAILGPAQRSLDAFGYSHTGQDFLTNFTPTIRYLGDFIGSLLGMGGDGYFEGWNKFIRRYFPAGRAVEDWILGPPQQDPPQQDLEKQVAEATRVGDDAKVEELLKGKTLTKAQESEIKLRLKYRNAEAYDFANLSLEKAAKAYKSATPEQKEVWAEIIGNRIVNTETLTDEEKTALLKQLGLD